MWTPSALKAPIEHPDLPLFLHEPAASIEVLMACPPFFLIEAFCLVFYFNAIFLDFSENTTIDHYDKQLFHSPQLRVHFH